MIRPVPESDNYLPFPNPTQSVTKSPPLSGGPRQLHLLSQILPYAIEYKDNPPTRRAPSSNRNLDVGAGKRTSPTTLKAGERSAGCSLQLRYSPKSRHLQSQDECLPNEPGSGPNLNILSPGETGESIDARLNELAGAPDTVGLPSVLSLGCSELS